MAQFTLDGVTYSKFRDIPGAVYTRSGVEYQQNAEGVWTPFDDDVPPISSGVGVDVWEARTNSIRNPTFLGIGGLKGGSGATILGSVPNNMYVDGAAGVTINIIGVGSENGLPYLEVDVSGTPATSPNFTTQFESTAFAASNGQTWASQVGVRLISGSVANLSAVTQRINQLNSSDAVLGTKIGADLKALVSNLTRYDAHEAMTLDAGASVAKIIPFVAFSGSGSAVAYRVRIYAPQSKLGADIGDPPILQTTNAAATRGNPSMYINAPGLLVPPYTLVAFFKVPNATVAGDYRRVASANDGSTANFCDILIDPSQRIRAVVHTGGVAQADFGTRTFTPGQTVKAAAAFATNNIRLAVGGQAAESDTSASLAGSYARLQLGCNSEGFANRYLNGAITRFQIINRDVTDAELQALTV